MLVLNVGSQLLLSILLCFELALNLCQFSLRVHTVFNDDNELLLISVFNDIDLGPCLIFDLLTLLLVDPHKFFNFLLKLLTLLIFLVFLQRMFDLQLLVLFLLKQVELRDLLAEPLLLFLLLVQELLVSFVVSIHLLFMLALLDLKLFGVQTSQVFDLLVTSQLDLILFVLDESVLLIILGLLLGYLVVEVPNLIVVLFNFVFGLLPKGVLLHLYVVIQTLDLGLQVVPALLLNQNLF